MIQIPSHVSFVDSHRRFFARDYATAVACGQLGVEVGVEGTRELRWLLLLRPVNVYES